MRVRPISNSRPESVVRKTAPRMSMKGLSYSMFDRIAGLARSLAIYHAIPFRQRRIRRLYRQLVGSGDLVFDIGAHVGNHVRAVRALGCRVVAVEPQADFARVLRILFGRASDVTILEAAVGDRPGRAILS